MSLHRNHVCQLLLKEHFGELAHKIGKVLLARGPCALKYIIAESRTDAEKVKKILSIFIQQNIVTFDYNKKGFIEYVLDGSNVLQRLRFSKYIYCAKTLYGDAAELLMEDVLQKGQVIMTDVVQDVTRRLNEALEASAHPTISESFVSEKYTNLVKTHFLQRCPETLKSEDKVIAMDTSLNEEDLYKLPSGSRKRKLSTDANGQPSKRSKTGDGKCTEGPEEDVVYWKVNFERFHQYLKDQVLVVAVANKIDKKASEVMRTMLRVSETKTHPSNRETSMMSATEIFQALPKDIAMSRQLLDTYLAMLADDSTGFVSKVGDSGGGMYVVNIFQALTQLAKAHIESVVQERFGSKSLRIFRLLMLKKHLEQKQIEDYAMISAKEAKDLLYTMFAQNFVSTVEISKTPDYAPSRTYYLFHVDLQQVVRMVLDRCYKALSNAMMRREAELDEHRRPLEKQERVDAIAASLEQSGADPTQKEEIEQTITPPEKELIIKVKHTVQMLDQCEIQLDEVIFVLETYLFFSKQK